MTAWSAGRRTIGAAIAFVGGMNMMAIAHAHDAASMAAPAPTVIAAGAASPNAAKAQPKAASSSAHQHGAMPGSHAPRAQLGASAAFAPDGTLWAVRTRNVSSEPWPANDDGTPSKSRRTFDQLVVTASTDQGRTWSAPRDVLPSAEPISADGENRPKIAIDGKGRIAIAWTSPTSARWTGDVHAVGSNDGGRTWSKPVTVQADRQIVTHRFESIAFDAHDRLYAVWIDSRAEPAAKAKGTPYVGAALYYAVSNDGGKTYGNERKVAERACECCAPALKADGDHVVAFWRYVFEPNERDFAIARLDAASNEVPKVERATQDHWKIDACPHQGGALAIDDEHRAHMVWFTMIEGAPRMFYARRPSRGGTPVSLPKGVDHADVIAAGERVVIAWREVGDNDTSLRAWMSSDRGHHFKSVNLGVTRGSSDFARLIARDGRVWALWNTSADGLKVVEIAP